MPLTYPRVTATSTEAAIENGDPFERLASLSVRAAAEGLPPNLRPLVFASPVCTRSSDVSVLWHSGYRNRHKLRMLLRMSLEFIVDLVKGAVRLIPAFRRYGYAVYGEVKDSVLVVPPECGREETPGRYLTPYVRTGDKDAVYVFGLMSSLGTSAQQVRLAVATDILRPFLALTRAAFRCNGQTEGPAFERLLALLAWASWIVSFRWLMHEALEKGLTTFVERHRVVKIGCVHEMHAHSRIVWSVASAHGATTHTVQHAAFSQGKRWLFPQAAEISAGLRTPQIFYVYEDRVAEMLRPHYPQTAFLLGHSRRYNSIRGVGRLPGDGKRYYLFATALPVFDNAVVISAIQRLVSQGCAHSIRLRLHPWARLTVRMRYWLDGARRRGIVQLSAGEPLTADLEGAFAVVGMGSTVLEEALAYERPVVQLMHEDFLEYLDLDGIRGVTRVDHRSLSTAVLESAQSSPVDSAEARRRLGLSHQEVTYGRLFAAL